MVSKRWTTAEKAHLLFSLDICVKRGERLEDTLSRTLKENGYKRTWNQISGQLKTLGTVYSKRSKQPITIAELRLHGSSCLKLDRELQEALHQRGARGAKGIENANPKRGSVSGATKSTSNPVINTDSESITSEVSQSRKRRHVQEMEENVANKRPRLSDGKHASSEQTSTNGGDRASQDSDPDLARSHPAINTGSSNHILSHGNGADTQHNPDLSKNIELQQSQHPEDRLASIGIHPKPDHIEPGSSSAPRGNTSTSISGPKQPPPARKEQEEHRPSKSVSSYNPPTSTTDNRLEEEMINYKNTIEHLTEENDRLHNSLLQSNENVSRLITEKRIQEATLKSRCNSTFIEAMARKDAYEAKELALREALQSELDELKKHLAELKEKQAGEIRMINLEKEQKCDEVRSTQREIGALRVEFASKETWYEGQIEEYRNKFERLSFPWRRTDETFINRSQAYLHQDATRRWPIELDENVDGRWNKAAFTMERYGTFLGDRSIPDFPEVVNPAFESLIRQICGLEQVPNEDHGRLSYSECFKNCTTPSSPAMFLALLAAYLIDWCFTTCFHAEARESQKLHQVWQAMAEYGSLQEVRYWDNLATFMRACDPNFKETELPELVNRQVQATLKHFDGYLLQNDEFTKEGIWMLLSQLTHLKMDLLFDKSIKKIAYVPPGVPFDPQIMRAEGDDYVSFDLEHPEQYRVVLCMWPAMWRMDEEKLPDDMGRGSRFQKALVDSRKFFPEIAGKYKDWDAEEVKLVEKARVMVERVDEAGNSAESKSGGQPRRRRNPRRTGPRNLYG